MIRLPLLSLVLLLAGAACSSTGGGNRSDLDPAEPLAVTFRDYRSGIRVRVVNDGYLLSRGVEGETPELRRAAYYSSPEVDLMTKVATDLVAGKLIEFLEHQGFFEYADDGPAPPETAKADRLTTSIEVSVDGEARSWLFERAWTSASPPPREAKRYVVAKNGFLDLHGLIEQYAAGGIEDWDWSGAQLRRGGR